MDELYKKVSGKKEADFSWNNNKYSQPAHWGFLLVFAAMVGFLMGNYINKMDFQDTVSTSTAYATGAYYVSPSGLDTNSGSQTSPFKTIQKAANIVNPGDVVIVMDGVYTDTDGDKNIVNIGRGGTSSALVTFKSQNKWGAKLDGQHNTAYNGFRFINSVGYVRIEGFEIFGLGNGVAGGSSGIEIYNGGSNSQIVNNNIHDIGKMCTDTSNGEVGVFIEQPHVTVTANTIHDIGRFMPGENGCVSNYNGSRDHGLYVNGDTPGSSDAFIANNIFYNNLRGFSIQAYPGTLNNLSILNNTFAGTAVQDGHIILGANMSNLLIVNNVFYQPKTAAINMFSGTYANGQINNNLTTTSGVMSASRAGITLSNNKTSTDPKFVNTISDFHLQSTSPAIDAGVTLTQVATDYEGNTRPIGSTYDIGAYEYGTPPPPDNIQPTVSLTAPVDGTTVSGSTTSVSANASDNVGVVGVQFKLDGNNLGPEDTTLPYSIVWNTTTTTNATHTLTASARDAAGNVGISSAVNVTVNNPLPDTTIPVVSITSPLNGSTVTKKGTTVITATASDNVAVTKVLFYVGTSLTCTDTVAPYSCSWSVPATPNRTYALQAKAYDAANNIGVSTVISVTAR